MFRHAVLTFGLLLLPAGATHGQPSDVFADLLHRLEPGTSMTVVDAQGERTRGRLLEVTGDAIVLQALGLSDGRVHRFERDAIRQVNGPADPLWNGTVIGFGSGFVAGCILGAEDFDPRRRQLLVETSGDACLIAGVVSAGIGAAAGVLIDAVVGRHGVPLYRAPNQRVTARPALGARGAGLRLAVRW